MECLRPEPEPDRAGEPDRPLAGIFLQGVPARAGAGIDIRYRGMVYAGHYVDSLGIGFVMMLNDRWPLLGAAGTGLFGHWGAPASRQGALILEQYPCSLPF
ncbi:MAG: hypothetical protein LBC51_09910 [Treponema sp.]|nr:hypothetical protein [Treponema sp.]